MRPSLGLLPRLPQSRHVRRPGKLAALGAALGAAMLLLGGCNMTGTAPGTDLRTVVCTDGVRNDGTSCPPQKKPTATRRGTAKECADAARFANSSLAKWMRHHKHSAGVAPSDESADFRCDSRRTAAKRDHPKPRAQEPTIPSITGLCDSVMYDDDPSNDDLCDAPDVRAGLCVDVTSFDYNWNNDMLCTRRDGSRFYTDYAGARRFERGQ